MLRKSRKLGVFLFGSNFFGTLWASWKSISFGRLGEFFINFSNKFSTSCSCSSPSGTPMIQMLECLKLSHRFLSLSSLFWILGSSFCSGWMFISSFWLCGISTYASILARCLSSLCWILVSSFCSGWMLLSSFCSKPLIWAEGSFPGFLPITVGSL